MSDGTENTYYEILDGVRRAKAAHELGHSTIPARIDDHGRLGPVLDIPVERLLSPKPAIEAAGAGFTRWRRIFNASKSGSFPNGAPVPPIEIKSGTKGIPIADVRIEGQDDVENIC